MLTGRIKKLTAVALLSAVTATSLTGCNVLIEEATAMTNTPVTTEAELSNYYYIWHNDYTNNVMDDLKGRNSGTAQFTKVYENFATFEAGKKENYSNNVLGNPGRLMWLSEEELELVPTYYAGDELVLSSDSYRPQEVIFERFFDEGWTFGFAGLAKDKTGRYTVSTKTENKDESWFFPLSEAYELVKTLPDTEILVDKVGGEELRSNGVSDSGFVKGLTKDNVYNVEVYIGTNAYDIKLKADSKPLVSRECFTSTDYRLVDSSTAIIKLPKYLRTGYYYVDGGGLFRYISGAKSWNSSTNFNIPICSFNSEGRAIYDPALGDYSNADYSTEDDYYHEEDMNGQDY